MPRTNSYTDELRRLKSLAITRSLQNRADVHALEAIEAYQGDLIWEPLGNLMISHDAWDYVVNQRRYDAKRVFCHPSVLLAAPTTSLHYRGIAGLSVKAAKSYVGAIENLEAGGSRARLSSEKAMLMARTYNTFICSIIENSTEWTLENGARVILATMGITLDGSNRNKIGELAEERVRMLVVRWLSQQNLLVITSSLGDSPDSSLQASYELRSDVTMKFQSEPDISFARQGEYLAVVEIKGGIDTAGALERYGAAKKSFEEAGRNNPHCQNYYLVAAVTDELTRRIRSDRLVDKLYNIIDVLSNPAMRDEFFTELFHHTLRLV